MHQPTQQPLNQHSSRRDFLKHAAAATLAGAALARADDPPRSPPRPRQRTLRKAFMMGMGVEGATLLDKFKMLRDAGFEGVELDSPSDTPRDEVLKAMDATGIKVHGLVDSVHWKYYLNSPDAAVRAKGREGLETALRDAKAFGSISVLLVPGVVNADMPYDQAYTLTQQEIRAALPVAKETGVTIAIENVWNNFLLSPLEGARYVDELNQGLERPLVAWHLDIGNAINTSWPDQWVRVLGPRLAKLHIKDFSRKKRDELGLWKGFDVELGEGDAGWARVMKALDDAGYSTAPNGNWATAEVRGGDAKRLKQVSEQMDSLLAM